MLPDRACLVETLLCEVCRLPTLTELSDVVAHASLVSPPLHQQLADICIRPVSCSPKNASVVPLYDIILLLQSLIVVTLNAIVRVSYYHPFLAHYSLIRRCVRVAFPRPFAELHLPALHDVEVLGLLAFS